MGVEIEQSGIFILAIFLAIMAERCWQWLRRRAARSWPVAQGYVEHASWRQLNAHSNRYFVADLAYSYVVGGQFFAGYYRRSFSTANAAAAFIKSARARTVQVRYNPARATHSLLLAEDMREFIVTAPEEAPV